MKVEEVKELIQALSESSLAELKYEDEEVKLSLKKTRENVMFPQTGMEGPTSYFFAGKSAAEPAIETGINAANVETVSAETTVQEGNIVTSPLVGTFYSAPSEDSEDYVAVGAQVKKGQVVAIVEAMKLMNEIESDYEGKVVEVLVENGETVEYGQPLFRIS